MQHQLIAGACVLEYAQQAFSRPSDAIKLTGLLIIIVTPGRTLLNVTGHWLFTIKAVVALAPRRLSGALAPLYVH
jgi:hypothetical protein